jgi:hypothetical protein
MANIAMDALAGTIPVSLIEVRYPSDFGDPH